MDAAQALQVEKPTLTGFAIQSDQIGKDGKPEEWALVATASFSTAWQGYSFWRYRWSIENSGFRELKEGWHLEESLVDFPQHGSRRCPPDFYHAGLQRRSNRQIQGG